jgi:ABC-type uncharacterized transport system permease subunit
MAFLFAATAVLYGLCALLSFAYLGGLSERAAVWARRLLPLAFLVHTVEVGARGVARLHPVSSVREALGFAAWLLIGVFLLAQMKRRLDAVGAFVVPVALVLVVVARLTPTLDASTAGLGVLGRVHISLATLGLAVFALATAVAVLYLFEERQLKRKRLGVLLKRGTALETLDALAHRCVQVGFPIFTVSIVTGAVWTARLGAGMRPEYAIAGVAWAAFAALLVARVTAGWRGRRAALLTVIGFGAALVVMAAYLVRAALE